VSTYAEFLARKAATIPPRGIEVAVVRFVGCELKPSYWRTAVANLRAVESAKDEQPLFSWDEVSA